MPLFMYQAAYTAESWAAQIKNPQNRVEAVGRQACEAAGGKLVGGWLCFGDYDLIIISRGQQATFATTTRAQALPSSQYAPVGSRSRPGHRYAAGRSRRVLSRRWPGSQLGR